MDIDVPSAVKVFTTLRYINLHLLTYLLADVITTKNTNTNKDNNKNNIGVDWGPVAGSKNLGRPAYLRDLLQEYQPTGTLRSSTAHLLHQPYMPTSVSSRAFSVAAPVVRNQLTVNTRTAIV